MISSTILLGITLFGSTAEAAWPDSSEGRIHAVDWFRKDIQTPGNPLEGDARVAEYKKACELKYYPACNYKTWTNKDGYSDLQAAGAFFGKRCKSEPLSCVVSGWAKGYVNGKPSNNAPNPKKAFSDLTYGCKKKAYGPACAHLGELYLWGVGTSQDPAKAQALFKEACKAKDQYGCYIEGDLYYHGLGVEKDYITAREKYVIGCNKDYTQGCVKLGTMYEQGYGVAHDYTRAIEYFGKACSAKDADGCFYLARMYANGLGVENSAGLAFAMYKSLCEAGDQRGCFGVASLYELGRGVEQDLDLAMDLYEGSCKGGYASACSQLGSLHINNKEMPDPATGLAFVKMGCEKGDIKGCVELGGLYYAGEVIKQDFPKARKIFEDACTQKIGIGCYRLGVMYDKGQGADVDPKKALELFREGCDLLNGNSCTIIGHRYMQGKGGVMKSTKEAVRHFDLGCVHGDQDSCREMADFYYKGEFVDKDVKKALDLYKQSCEFNDRKACMKAGDLILDGIAGDPNYGAALRVYEKACELKLEEACSKRDPIKFKGEYELIIQDAFVPNSCEIWTFYDDDPSENKMVLSANKDSFKVLDGPLKGQTFKTELVEVNYRSAGTHEIAQSYWLANSGKKKFKVEQHDNWYPEKNDRIRDISNEFPGKESFSNDRKGKSKILVYHRENFTLKRFGDNKCYFLNDVSILTTEHCSDVQALVGGQLLSICK